MKALFIGGTGTISMAIVRKLAERKDWEVWLLNRGNRSAELPENIRVSSAKKTEEMLSNQMLSGIPEVDLGIE